MLFLHEKDKHHFYLLLLIYVFVQMFLIPIRKAISADVVIQKSPLLSTEISLTGVV